MAVKVSVVVADWQAGEALDVLMGSYLLLIGDPEFEQVGEQPEDALAPLYAHPQPPCPCSPDNPRPDPDCPLHAVRVLPTPLREAV